MNKFYTAINNLELDGSMRAKILATFILFMCVFMVYSSTINSFLPLTIGTIIIFFVIYFLDMWESLSAMGLYTKCTYTYYKGKHVAIVGDHTLPNYRKGYWVTRDSIFIENRFKDKVSILEVASILHESDWFDWAKTILYTFMFLILLLASHAYGVVYTPYILGMVLLAMAFVYTLFCLVVFTTVCEAESRVRMEHKDGAISELQAHRRTEPLYKRLFLFAS